MGFCANPPILVYEFMEQGNLYDRLFDKVHFFAFIVRIINVHVADGSFLTIVTVGTSATIMV